MFGNPNQMMKQVQQLQKAMEAKQKEIQAHELEGSAGGNMVKIKVTGAMEVKDIQIDKSLIDVEELDVLQDLIVAAFNDAKTKVDDYSASEMSALTGGAQLPGGMKFPF